ncbi:hypothetical protein BKA63DRAFT_572943 [Paraphoma chrysanthemicola]|nr:hypothetical protein BKA63DRAFT_572943 [Paraphoma chrysanthemicola]
MGVGRFWLFCSLSPRDAPRLQSVIALNTISFFQPGSDQSFDIFRSLEVQRANMTTSYQRQIARKLVSLRRDHLPLINRLLALFNCYSPCVVEPRSKTLTPFGGQYAASYNDLGARFFTISPAFRFEGDNQVVNKMFSDEVPVESDPVKLGAVTYNHCIDAAYLCWAVLEKLFRGTLYGDECLLHTDSDNDSNANQDISTDDSEILSVEWARFRVRPQAVFVLEQDLGREDLYLHDVLLIHLYGGTTFPFDPTVYQFDFGHYLQQWSA